MNYKMLKIKFTVEIFLIETSHVFIYNNNIHFYFKRTAVGGMIEHYEIVEKSYENVT